MSGFDGFKDSDFLWSDGGIIPPPPKKWVVNYDGATNTAFNVGTTATGIIIYTITFSVEDPSVDQGCGQDVDSDGKIAGFGLRLINGFLHVMYFEYVYNTTIEILPNKTYELSINCSNGVTNIYVNNVHMSMFEDHGGEDLHVSYSPVGSLYDASAVVDSHFITGQAYNNKVTLDITVIDAVDVLTQDTKPTVDEVANLVGYSGTINNATYDNYWKEFVDHPKPILNKWNVNFDGNGSIAVDTFVVPGDFTLLSRVQFSETTTAQFIGQSKRRPVGPFPGSVDGLFFGVEKGVFIYGAHDTGVIKTSIPAIMDKEYNIKFERTGSTLAFTVDGTTDNHASSDVQGLIICNNFYIGAVGGDIAMSPVHGAINNLSLDTQFSVSTFSFVLFKVQDAQPTNSDIASSNPSISGTISNTDPNSLWSSDATLKNILSKYVVHDVE